MSEATANLCTTDAAEAMRVTIDEQAREIERLRLNIAEYNEHERCYQSELAALKAQPGGVVLPERQSPADEWHSVMKDRAIGWNACLDEVARLNSSPVSAGECVAVPRDVLADLVSLDREKRISAERHLYALLTQQEQQP